jgi:hypothetical protein
MRIFFIVAMLLSLSSTAYDPFLRSSDISIDVAWRHFIHPLHASPIFLIGVTHWAPPAFYLELQEFIRGKRVIYEGIGDSCEDRAYIKRQLKQLETPYRDAFFLLTHFQGMENVLGQVKQPDIDYSACLDCIHADYGLDDMRRQQAQAIDSIPDLKASLEKKVAAFLNQREAKIDEAMVMHIRMRLSSCLQQEQEATFAQQRKNITNHIANMRTKLCHQKIIDGLKTYLNEHDAAPIIVIFGALHLTSIQAHLNNTGWLREHEKWKTIAHACHLQKYFIDAPELREPQIEIRYIR